MKEYIVQAYAQETIDSFDANNAPEIVRCKDCEHLEHMYAMDEKIGEEYYVCRIHPFTGRRTADWFCADGKRKGT